MNIERNEKNTQKNSLNLTEVNLFIESQNLNNFALIILKPDFLDKKSERLGYTFDQILQGLIESTQLKILSLTQKKLTEQEVKAVYDSIFSRKPKYEDALSFRSELLEYMQSSEIQIYLVFGDNAQQKAELIKQSYRNIVNLEPGTSKVKNILHVPDTNEFADTIETLYE